MSDNEQTKLIATAMNEGSPQAKALGFSTLEIGDAIAVAIMRVCSLSLMPTP
jgi:hypothetical protein